MFLVGFIVGNTVGVIARIVIFAFLRASKDSSGE